MIGPVEVAANVSEVLVPGLLSWWVRGALSILLVAGLVRLARRAPAAARHTLWAAALGFGLLLPLVGPAQQRAWLPQWDVDLPAASWPQGTVGPAPRSISLAATPTLPPPVRREVPSEVRATEAPIAGPTEIRSPLEKTAPESTPPPSTFSWTLLMAALWGLGVAGRGFGRVVALARRGRLATRARPFPPSLSVELERARRELGIRRPVRGLVSERLAVPITWGTLRPVVALPAEAVRWAPQRLHHVLWHELSHVRRLDCLVQFVVWAAVSLRWFDPLTWWAARRLRVEAELACDDAVILRGGRPAVYAGHLLEIARAARFRAPKTAVAMARGRSALSRRIEAILEPGRVRRVLGRRGSSLTTLSGLVLVGLVGTAAVRPEPGTPEPPEEPRPVVAPVPAVAPIVAEPPVPRPRITAFAVAEPTPVPAVDPSPVVAVTPPVPEAMPAPVDEPSAPADPEPIVAPTAPPADPEPAIRPVLAMPVGGPAPAVVPEPATPPTRTSRREPLESNAPFRVARDRGDCRPRLWQRDRGSVSIQRNEGTWRVEVSHGGCRLEAVQEGQVTVDFETLEVVALGPRARLEVEEETRGEDRSLVVTAGPGGRPAWDYRVDGETRNAAEGRAWLREVLPYLFRRTGLMAEERTAFILRQKGVSGVLEELERLDTDHVVRIYTEALRRQARLTTDEQVRLLEVVARIGSDFELAEILTGTAAAYLADREVQRAYLEATEEIGSDFELARVLAHQLSASPLPTPERSDLLLRAADIGSDFELARLLISAMPTWSGELGESMMVALRSIGSDFELRRTLQAAVEREDLGEPDLVDLLAVAETIGSDFERAEFLITVAASRGIDGAVETAYLEALRGISSSHESQRARAALDRSR